MNHFFLSIVKLIKKIRHSAQSREVFVSYEEALRSIKISGYQNSELAQMVVKKSQIYNENLQKNAEVTANELRTVSAIGFAIHNNRINVLDFGGGGGIHYFIAKFFFKNIKINWAIVETENFVREASPLEGEDLRYFSSIDGAVDFLGVVDLIFANSSIQYCADPLDTLRCLIVIGAKSFVLTRTPVLIGHETDPVISIQSSKLSHNGPGEMPSGFHEKEILYPITFVEKEDLLRIISLGYDIVGTVDEGAWGGALIRGIKPMMLGVFGAKKVLN